ncbi:hypothetical protein TNCV_3543861, partial [Trichonephila clavipes]
MVLRRSGNDWLVFHSGKTILSSSFSVVGILNGGTFNFTKRDSTVSPAFFDFLAVGPHIWIARLSIREFAGPCRVDIPGFLLPPGKRLRIQRYGHLPVGFARRRSSQARGSSCWLNSRIGHIKPVPESTSCHHN